MKSWTRLAGVLFVVSLCMPAAAATEPLRLSAGAQGQIVEAPGTDARAEVVTFDEGLASALLRVPPGSTVRIADWPVAPDMRAEVRLTRFEIYAPDTKIWRVDAKGQTEVPRSRMAFFRGMAEDSPETRVFVGLEPQTEAFQGLSISPEGTFEIRPHPAAARGRGYLVTVPEYFLPDDPETGKPQSLSWTCGQSGAPLDFLQEKPASRPDTGDVTSLFEPILSSLHSATIAVDTDNELMQLKFSNNTTNATDYVAALIAAMNVVYERDLNIRLLQGTTYLRVSTTTDPYTQQANSTNGAATNSQLIEVRNYWQANYSGISRALTMMLSGKSPSTGLSGGIAYISGLCNTTKGYSFTQIFRSPNSTSSADVFVVGHELGHNFGSPHTHCYSPPIDNCFVEGPASCYSGATSCPAPTTINGVNNVKGTIMSYCHTLGGCNNSNVFHPTTVDLITGVIQPQINICIFPAITPPTVTLVIPNHGLASGGTVVTITGTGFQNGAAVSFGGTAAASVTFNNAAQLTATAPARAAGLVNVTVTNPDTGAVTATNAYTFDPLPAISALTPTNGPIAGGTAVTVTGANFQNGATATFGGSPIAVTFVNSTQLTFTTPAHATGTVGLVITNPNTGAVTRTKAFFFTPPTAATDFYTLDPCRLFDTRLVGGPTSGAAMSAGGELVFTVTGNCGVPSDATAVMVNITVVSPTSGGYVSLNPGNAFSLGTATLTYQIGELLSNNSTSLLATDAAGTIHVFNSSTGTAHVILDVTGYYTE